MLRFGCLEGEFRVAGDTVVYDPQTAISPELFHSNGSSANRLATVLNKAELRALTQTSDIAAGAQALSEVDASDVVVVKAGPDGAYVFEGGKLIGQVPAYEASAIHKVGSGDTFSAAFAFYWMTAGIEPVEAARRASLHTADYVETRRSVFQAAVPDRQPLLRSGNSAALVALGRAGATASWLLDEALAGLWDLGVPARVHDGALSDVFTALRNGEALLLLDPPAAFLHADGHRMGRSVAYVETAEAAETPLVDVERDLATALYRVAWKSSG